jgi:SSS family solute:Na+ symporter
MLGHIPALICAALLMVFYIVFGGLNSAGMMGMLKVVLLYLSMFGCAVVVLNLTGGLAPLIDAINGISGTTLASGEKVPDLFSFFSRGIGTDGGALISLIVGVLSTQTYAHAIMSGKSDRISRRGVFVSAALIPPIGAGGILVGLYCRANPELFPTLAANTKDVLTVFIVQTMPPVFAGIILATLLFSVVGTGAGLAFGISTVALKTVLNVDKTGKISGKLKNAKVSLWFSRACIVILLVGACMLSNGALGDMILNFGFMSMGLRGAGLFVPLLFSIWAKGRVRRKFTLASIIAGPLCVLIFKVFNLVTFDTLFVGLFVSLLIYIAGLIAGTDEHPHHILHWH